MQAGVLENKKWSEEECKIKEKRWAYEIDQKYEEFSAIGSGVCKICDKDRQVIKLSSGRVRCSSCLRELLSDPICYQTILEEAGLTKNDKEWNL